MNTNTTEPASAVSSTGLFGDIPLKVAMIAWNDLREDRGTPGQVMVIPWPDTKGACDRLRLTMTCGAAMTEWRNWSKEKRLLQLFIEAWYIVCRDGVDPKAMHEALMVIPEYRDTWNGETLFSSPNKSYPHTNVGEPDSSTSPE